MPESDVREITRLVSRQCSAPIICISRNDTGPYAGEVWVTAGNQTSMESSDNGLFRLKKQNGVWRVIEGVMVCLLHLLVAVTLEASNQSMKPTAPLRENFSVFATVPCRGLSLSR